MDEPPGSRREIPVLRRGKSFEHVRSAAALHERGDRIPSGSFRIAKQAKDFGKNSFVKAKSAIV